MQNSEFTSTVKRIRVDAVDVNPQNPRGQFDTAKDPSFERLASSVKEMGVLVPIVVRSLGKVDGKNKFELVDGERRYWAAKAVGRSDLPAHILRTNVDSSEIRKIMFHLHMTREQWGAWAQCVALLDIYPELDKGLTVSKKEEWVRKIHTDTGTNVSTARDRVRVLSWPKHLRNEIANFMTRHPNHDVYSYVLAIEASVIEPSLQSFPDFYSKPRTSKVNEVRGQLLKKTLEGIETGTISSREAIRSVDALFTPHLEAKSKKVALKIFSNLVYEAGYSFDDARAELTAKMPEVFAERPPKVSRLTAQIETLAQTLNKYDPAHLRQSAKQSTKEKELKSRLATALKNLVTAVQRVLEQL